MEDYCERFLKNHRSEMIQKTREPIALADRLRENNSISDELYNKIQTQKHKEDQMREIYKCLNSRTHFLCTYDWLKERESDVLEDMETRDAEAEAPLNKRPRDETHPTVDETDNISTELPDLKMISTFAKLETWVSENSQKLISDLKRKLGESGLEALKKELKNRESKNSLCFNASNIKDIKGNKELEDFLSKNNTKIPKLTFSMFFKKNDFASSGGINGNTTDYDEPMDTTECINISNTDFNEKKDNNTKRKTSTTRGVKDEPGECSRRNTDSASGTSLMGGRKENKLKKKNHMNDLLRDWASRQCDGSEEEIKNVFHQISIINMAEHREYPCFTAENVRVYKNPKTCESQIIFIADEKMPKTSVNTMTHYHMFVCDLQKAILLGPKDDNEQEIKYEEGFMRIDKCKRFIFEVFAPTLAVFKKIQEEELNSLI